MALIQFTLKIVSELFYVATNYALQACTVANITLMESCDLVLQISWDAPEYTVQEEDGMVEVCATLTGTYAAPSYDSPALVITTIEGTAREGIGKCLSYCVHSVKC